MDLPVTRYYGSKRKLVDAIWTALESNNIEFDSCLDLFGGSGIVSYYMLCKNKSVVYNDIFEFNCQMAKALMATLKDSFSVSDAKNLLFRDAQYSYNAIIENYFKDIYYTDEENRDIDTIVQNIKRLPLDVQPCGYYLLFQSCLIKRPFNLFHRKNLYLRLNHDKSSFGNYITWEKSFSDLFKKFCEELNTFQFDRKQDITILNQSALQCEHSADLIYIDTPYFSSHSSSLSYHSRYHFLEGLLHYEEIPNMINPCKLNKEILINKNPEFENKSRFSADLDELLGHFDRETIALSYTSDGYPNIEDLGKLMKRHKQNVRIVSLGEYKYALNKKGVSKQEVLIIGK